MRTTSDRSSSRLRDPRSDTANSVLANTPRASSPAAIAEGFTSGSGLHPGRSLSRPARRSGPRRREEPRSKALESLIDEAIAAEFYNIDIDTSTLVDLRMKRARSSSARTTRTAHLTQYIRTHQPKGITVSVGGEIGEVGKYNTQPDEVRAYMSGLQKLLDGATGISKISVQTGTSHGGVPMADGTIAQAKIDFEVLRQTTRLCRKEYGIAGSVQHGASTLPESVFNKFPESEAVEIHLATGFQNMILDARACVVMGRHPRVLVNAADERKPGETDEQLFKTRKKAPGPRWKMWHALEAKQPSSTS
jgi:fructose/tagatose bisphosphate aldolase